MTSLMMSSSKTGQVGSDDVFIGDEMQGFPKKISNTRKLRPRKKSDVVSEIDICKKIREIEKKESLNSEDLLYLNNHRESVSLVKQRRSSYKKSKERAKEVLDDGAMLDLKATELANLILTSNHTIVYTGAGISTSANIPDYRGVDGVWTKLKAGEKIVMNSGLVNAIPTYTHMFIKTLIDIGRIKHVVSQNCDGLHVKSGISSTHLSEIHGNMFCEICSKCSKPYYRVFDVTEHTSLRRHTTLRTCDVCTGELKDTIVHFGEHSNENWPHNWKEAKENVEKADFILCLGSSLKVLRSYKMLWCIDRPKAMRPKLAIINIQWTPKDSQALLKINGRVDNILQNVARLLQLKVEEYQSDSSFIFDIATSVNWDETSTFHTQCISIPEKYIYKFPEANIKTLPASDNSLIANNSESNDHKSSMQQCNILNTPPSHSNHPESSGEVCGIICSPSNTPQLEFKDSLGQLNSLVPAWFGKGCRKQIVRKMCKGRKTKRLKTN